MSKSRVDWNPEELLGAVNTEVDNRIGNLARKVAATARSLCPVGTATYHPSGAPAWKERIPGSLRASIKAARSKFPNGGWIVYCGGFTTYYWRWVELGAPARANYKRQPFLRPALETAKLS